MLRTIPGTDNSRVLETVGPSFHSEHRAFRNAVQNRAARGMSLANCGCSVRLVRGRVTAREATSFSPSSSGGVGLGFRGDSRRNGLSESSFSGDLEERPLSLENVSLEELLEQVGAGQPRDAGELVQIESNPHPSLVRRYSEVGKPFERGRTLPIPMPHKMNRPFPLPVSRRGMASAPSSAARRAPKPSSPPTVAAMSYPRLFAKLLFVPDDEVRMVLDCWKGRTRCKSDAIADLVLQLGRRDGAVKALQMFAWVREQPRLWPNDAILLSIVLVVVQSRKLTLAKRFLAWYGPLFPESALLAANAYVEQGFIKDAVRMLASLEERGVSGGSELYARMIVKAAEAGAKDVVKDLALGRDFNLHECSQVIAVCSRLGLDEVVEAVFQRYVEHEFKPNIVMFTTLMQARARAGKLRQAVALFWDLEEAGVKPDLIAYRVMIRLCEEVGDVNKAVKVYNQMRITGFVPTSDVYNVMIRLYCKEGRLAKAKEVIREMEMWGCAPTSDTNQHLSLAGYKLS